MLYHKDVYLPDYIKKIKPVRIKLTYSRHSKRASLNDKLGIISLPKTITIKASDIIEVESWEGKIDKKIVIRTSHDNDNDIILVILLTGKKNIVKTVWLNCKDDKHLTLDKSKYNNPIR